MKLLRLLCCVVAVASAGGAARANFIFTDFATDPGLTLLGDAAVTDDALCLTQAEANQTGIAWFPVPQRLDLGFETPARVKIMPLRVGTPEESPGHGMAFVFQRDDPFAQGAGGAGLGYAGIGSSVAVELDTSPGAGDFSTAHLSLQASSADPTSAGLADSLAHADLTVPVGEALEGDLTIRWYGSQMQIFFGGMPPIEPGELPIVMDVLGSTKDFQLTPGYAWVGFAAATGGGQVAGDGMAQHCVTRWELTVYPEPTTLGLLALGGLGLVRRRLRRKGRL